MNTAPLKRITPLLKDRNINMKSKLVLLALVLALVCLLKQTKQSKINVVLQVEIYYKDRVII